MTNDIKIAADVCSVFYAIAAAIFRKSLQRFKIAAAVFSTIFSAIAAAILALQRFCQNRCSDFAKVRKKSLQMSADVCSEVSAIAAAISKGGPGIVVLSRDNPTPKKRKTIFFGQLFFGWANFFWARPQDLSLYKKNSIIDFEP